MASKQHLEPNAFRMYCEGLEQKEIAATLDVSEQLISRWKQQFDWDTRRQVYIKSTHHTVDKLRTLLANHVEKLENLEGTDDDKIAKVTKAIEQLDKNFDFLGSVLKVTEELVEYAKANDEDLLYLLQSHVPAFLAYCRKKYVVRNG